MFGGLSVKEVDKKKDTSGEVKNATSTTSINNSTSGSGFSFLSTPTATAVATTSVTTNESALNEKINTNESNNVNTNNIASSGFSFLSESKSIPDETDNPVNETTNALEKLSTNTNAISSGFSFLSNTANATDPVIGSGVDDKDQKMANNESPVIAEPSSSATTTATSSGFSFLSNNTPASPTPNTNNTSTSNSIFSMLSSSISTPTIPTTTTAPTTNNTSSTSNLWGASSSSSSLPMSSPPSSSSNLDILSLKNPSEPVGSGLTFNTAIHKPKSNIVKRARSTKIGQSQNNHNNNSTNIQVPSTYVPSSSRMKEDSSSSSSFTKSHEEVIHITEQMLSSKIINETVSSSSYTPNQAALNLPTYSPTKKADDDDYHSNEEEEDNDDERDVVPVKEEDKTYLQAKAAAQEAQKQHPTTSTTTSSSSSYSFGGMISGLFSKKSSQTNDNTSNSNEELDHVSRRRDSDKEIALRRRMEDEKRLRIEEEKEQQMMEFQLKMKLQQEANDSVAREEELKRKLKEAEQQKQKQLEEESRIQSMMKQKQKQEKEEAFKLQLQLQEEQKKKEAELLKLSKSPEKIMERMLDSFANDCEQASHAIIQLRNETSSLLSQRSSVLKQDRLTTQQISQAEKQQVEAAEQEDFDLADHLASVIERHIAEKENLSVRLNLIRDQMEELDLKREVVVQDLTKCFTTIRSKLNDFLTQQLNDGKVDNTDMLERFAVATRRINNENERLANDLKNIERDEGFVLEERHELESAISEQTANAEAQQKEVSEKLDSLEDEISELRKQLEAKEREASILKTELTHHNKAIQLVRSKFSRQINRLEKKEAAIQESRNEWQIEDAAFQKMRKAHEEEVTAHSEALIARDNIVARTKSEILVAENIEAVLCAEIVIEKTHKINDEKNDEEDVSENEMVQCEAAADEANIKLAATKAVIDSLREEILSIDNAIPILEETKKTAAAERDFKAAGKASKEIKELVTRKERCEEELSGEALQRQDAASMELQRCLDELEEKKAVVHDREKKVGEGRMLALAKKIRKLEEIKESLSKDKSEEDKNNVLSVGLMLLNNEIASLKSEGEALGSKFGGWETYLHDTTECNQDISCREPDETKDSENVEENDESKNSVKQSNNDDHAHESDCCEGETNEEEEINFDRIKRYNDIRSEIKVIDDRIEAAISNEEYDEASELDDKLNVLKKELESLSLSEDEIALATSLPQNSDVKNDENSYHVVESKEGETSPGGTTTSYDAIEREEEIKQQQIEESEMNIDRGDNENLSESSDSQSEEDLSL